jgi:hypothetical protein
VSRTEKEKTLNNPSGSNVQRVRGTNEDTMSNFVEQSIRWLVRDFIHRGYELLPILAEIQDRYGYTTSIWGTVVDEVEKQRNLE